MDGIVAIGKAKKDIASALTGVASMVVGTDKQSIVVTTNDGATFRLNIPNPVDDADLINRISINSEGNVCFDGEELAWKEDIPVKVSELDNDENFIKLEALNKKLDKPEIEGTVGQVLIVQADGTNAYADVPTYDDTELRELIGDIPIGNLSYEIVETLPEVTSDEAKEHTLYMIKSESDDTVYNQYIIVDGAYKKVGSTTSGTGGAIIDDNTVSTTTVFSSNKISTEYAKINTIPVLTDIIDDTQTLTNKTNSSSKILTDIQKCLSDSKDYTLQQLEKVKIDDTLTTTDKTIVGAINEVKLSIPTRTSELENNSNFITNDDLPTVPTKVSDLENDSNFVTNSKMLEAIASAQLGNGEDSDIDLSAYQPIEESTLTTTAKTIPTAINELKSGLDDKVNKTDITTTIDSSSMDTQIPSAKATYDLANTKANTNHTHNTSDIKGLSIPTKVSDLENDSNFITSIPSEYVTETELTAKKYLTSVPSTYALKTDIPTVPTKTSQLTNDSNFITSIPEEYITETELNAKGYLTSHQDISGLQTKTDKNLVTTSKEVVGAINEVKSLNDTKLNKADANKLDCVTIENVSLKEYILTNCTGTGKTYYLIGGQNCTDLPKAGNFYITVETPGMYTYKVTAKELNDSNGIYVCTYRTISSSWTKWEKVCTTTVADVPFTTLTVNSWAKGGVVYTVENGICYLWITGLESSTMDQRSQIIVSNLPVPKRGGLWCNIVSSDCTKGGLLVAVTPDGELQNYSGLNNTAYFGTFSYPVAE